MIRYKINKNYHRTYQLFTLGSEEITDSTSVMTSNKKVVPPPQVGARKFVQQIFVTSKHQNDTNKLLLYIIEQ